MDRSAALLERAKVVQVKNREIEEIIAGLQSISLEPQPKHAQHASWVTMSRISIVILVAFCAGLAVGGL
jgi:hypothetical protein